MKNASLIIAVLFSLGMFITSCKEQKEDQQEETTGTHQSHAAEKADLAMNYHYQCPMDCEDGKTYDEEGNCPVCKMALEKKEKEHTENHDDSHNNAEDESDGH